MAAAWLDKLSAVYDLILHKTEQIVDDTSLQKLLDLMQKRTDSELRVFLIGEETMSFLKATQQSPNPRVVAFGLRLTGIISSSEEGLTTSINNCVLSADINFKLPWSEPVIRDSYFQCVLAMMSTSLGHTWINKAGCIQQALECLVDCSIFVASNARKCVAKYMICLHDAANCDEVDKEHEHTSGAIGQLAHSNCVTCLALYILTVLEQPANHGLKRDMSQQVAHVQLILTLMETNPVIGQQILTKHHLLYPCFQLLSSANKEDCCQIVDIITTLINNTREWSIDWPTLFNDSEDVVLYIFLEYVLTLCQRRFVFLALQFSQALFAVQFSSVLQAPWYCTLLTIITLPVYGSVNYLRIGAKEIVQETTNLLNDLSSGTKEGLRETVKNIVAASASCSKDTLYTKLSPLLHGNSLNVQFTMSSLTTSVIVTNEVLNNLIMPPPHQLAVLIESWCCDMITFVTGQADTMPVHLLRQCIKTLAFGIQHGYLKKNDCDQVKIFQLVLKLCNQTSDNQVLTGFLDCVQILFVSADCLLLRSHINDHNFGKLLCHHLRNPCWDVRDSILNFLNHCISLCNDDKCEIFQKFLLNYGLFQLVWKLLGDTESYVRTSAIQLIGAISGNTSLCKGFCHAMSLSEKMLLHSILDVFTQEESAFPRRAIIELLSFWITISHFNVLMVKNDNKVDDHVAYVLQRAAEDIDWEVKVCALNFWHRLLQLYEAHDIDLDSVVSVALRDCDIPVKMKALELLLLYKSSSPCSKCIRCQSFIELEEYMTQHQDLDSVVKHFDLTSLFSNDNHHELSLLDDILLCDSPSCNLLDCY